MIKTKKYLLFQEIRLELTQAHPKDVSRAVLCLNDTQNEQVYKTEKYGDVEPQTIEWPDQTIQIPYTDQQMIKFETKCEHEYGYNLEELQALYSGQIYIKTQNFFRGMSVHVFDNEGHKCGIMRYMIKVAERQIKASKKKSIEVKQQPTVKVQLIAKITLFAASVNITNITFKKQRYVNDLALQLWICGEKHDAAYKKNYLWNFPGPKIQYTEKSPKNIDIFLKQGEHQILKASTTINQIEQKKRFVTHTLPLYDSHDAKMGTITIDLRFITKQQLLDLMYSPTKLTKPENKDHKPSISSSHGQLQKSHKKTFKQSRVNSSLAGTKSIRKNEELTAILNKSQIELEQPEGRHSNRYQKVYLMNSNNQMIIPRAKRFIDQKSANPYVSYTDPNKLSDFSPGHWNKGAKFQASKKIDFTKQYKNNPGVGSYKLPSIWDKY